MANENMTHTEAMRDALKDIEATVTATLAHQPEDEAKCGQFLYDALVKCFNIADLACHTARTESEAAVSSGAATAENSSEVGNAAKLRDAVIETQSAIAKCMDILNKIPECRYNALIDDVADELCDLREEHIKTALSAPPRNCDVGTADEQAERYGRYCDKFTSDGMHCEACPCCGKIQFGKCEFAWAQMPYEEGGAK